MKCLILIVFCVFYFHCLSQSPFVWQHTDGPQGTIVQPLYTNEKFAFVPTEDFLFRSADGIHWEKKEPGGSYRIAINHDTIVSPYFDQGPQQLKLKISRDNGDSWETKDLPAGISNYGSIALSRHGIYWVQYTNKGLFRSTDLGDTWDTITQHLSYDYDLTVFQERLYAFSLLSMWRTDEHGENWEEIHLPNAMLSAQYMDDFVVQDSNMVITTQDFIFNSHDDGATWDQFPLYSSNTYDKLALVDHAVYAHTFDMILRSDDYGDHWDTLTSEDLHSILFIAGLRDTLLAATYNQGVFRWDEQTQSLIESNEGLTKGYSYDLAYGDDKIWAACGNGVFAYDIPTQKWGEHMDFPYPYFQYENVSANDNGWVIASEAYKQHFYLSKNHGATWDTIHTEYYIDNLTLLGNHIFIRDEGRLFRSVDGGEDWVTVSIYTEDGMFVPFDGKHFVAGYDKLYITADDGLTFQSITAPFPTNRLASTGDQLFAMTSDTSGFVKLYNSTDAINWYNASTGFPEIYFFDFFETDHVFFYRDADHYFAFLGYTGVFWSPVDAISWTPCPSQWKGNNWLIHDDILYLTEEGMYKTGIEHPYITSILNPENAAFEKLNITPNPASDQIQITLPSGVKWNGELSVFSSDGKTCFSSTIHSADDLEITTTVFSAGWYRVVYKNESNLITGSFVKQ